MAFSRIGFFLAATFSLLVGLSSYRFLALDMNLAFPGFAPHIEQRNLVLMAHISASPIALVLGAFQFSSKRRAKNPGLHKWSGRFYALAILIGGISGLVLAIDALGGVVAGWGFGLLSIAWMGTTANAVRLAMQGNYVAHRKWMIRSFALTFAAVMLRLYLLGFMAAGFEYAPASVYIAWLCWVPNMIFAEWWIARGSKTVVPA